MRERRTPEPYIYLMDRHRLFKITHEKSGCLYRKVEADIYGIPAELVLRGERVDFTLGTSHLVWDYDGSDWNLTTTELEEGWKTSFDSLDATEIEKNVGRVSVPNPDQSVGNIVYTEITGDRFLIDTGDFRFGWDVYYSPPKKPTATTT